MSKRKRFDLLMLIVLITLAASISLYFRVTLLTSFILYLLVPTLYLCWRQKKNYLKILLASTVLTTLGISLDLIAQYNHAWEAPTLYPLLSYRLAGIMPLELIVWGFCVALFTLTFYEHFLDDERHSALSKRFLFLTGASILMLCWVGFFAMILPHTLGVRYAYFILFGVAALPLFWILFCKPRIFYKCIWLGIFFVLLNTVFETTALQLHQWTFPGQYIGWVNIYGLTLPWEELIFWIMLSAPIQIFYYEEFFDDGR